MLSTFVVNVDDNIGLFFKVRKIWRLRHWQLAAFDHPTVNWCPLAPEPWRISA